MTTSLAEQLRKLAVPQTAQLINETKRASLLFDPKEAAGIDRNVTYDIGVSGLEELKKMNPKFASFSDTLFNLSSRTFQRAVESQEVNEKLNENIKYFLTLLSPYLLLKPAHQALEWLVVRYEIHLYNKEDVIFLILPYHDTNIFVRILQLLKIKLETDHWHWLYPVQKGGVPLSKTALLNRCSSDVSFLKFICDKTINATKIHGDDAHRLVTLFAFYCTTVIGGLDHSKEVSEVQLVHILKSLLEGFSSRIADFVSASFMITAQLANKAQLSQKVLFAIIKMFVKNPLISIQKQKALLLVLLYQTQEVLNRLPNKSLLNLSKMNWFPSELSNLYGNKVTIIPLLVSLLSGALKHIQSSDSSEVMKIFVYNLVSSIKLSNSDAKVILRTMIETFNTDILKENIDDEYTADIIKWFSSIIKLLEKRHASVFDNVVKEVWSAENGRKTLEIVMGYNDNITLFEKLNHPSAEIRISALNYVVENFSTMQEEEKNNLKHSLSQCLQDDNIAVVNALLQLCPADLVSLLVTELVVETLLALCSKCYLSDDISMEVKLHVLKCLCSSHVSCPGLTDTRILLTVLPYFFSASDTQLCYAVEVLESEYSKNSSLMRAIKADVSNLSEMSAKELCSSTWKYITSSSYLPNKVLLFEAADKIPRSDKSVVSRLMTILLLPAALSKEAPDPAASLTALKKILNSVGVCKMHVKGENIQSPVFEKVLPRLFKLARRGKLGIQAVLHSLTELIYKTPINETLESPWWELVLDDCSVNFPTTSFIIYVFEFLITKCSIESSKLKQLYVMGLKEFFKVYFPSLKQQLHFLSKLIVGCGLLEESIIVNAELQLRCLLLMYSLLKQAEEPLSWTLELPDSILFPSLLIAVSSSLTPIRATALQCFSVLNESCSSVPYTSGYFPLLKELMDRYSELQMDSNHIVIVMETCFSKAVSPRKRKNCVNQILNNLLDHVTDIRTPMFVSSALLKLILVKTEDIFMRLLPLGNRILLHSQHTNGEKLDSYRSSVLKNIMQKLDESSSSSLNNEECWKFFCSTLRDTHTILCDNYSKPVCLAVIAMKQITPEVFESLASHSGKLQQELFSLLIEVSTNSDLSDITLEAGHTIRKWTLDSKFIITELEKMKSSTLEIETASGRKRLSEISPSPQVLQSQRWKCGVMLLEFMQNMKRVQNIDQLFPVLFELLKRCLKFEEQMSLEYTKQLILSIILKFCEKLQKQSDFNIPKGLFNMELVVQCISGTQNPQTHHHALLVLSHMANIIPDQVLNNSMRIFTFIGDSVLRQDDGYSFQIISRIIDTLIPVLIKANEEEISNKTEKLTFALAKILRVFSYVLLDVPEHRRLSLFKKLIITMGPQSSLWLLICLGIETHVLKYHGRKVAHLSNTVLDFLLELCVLFPPHVILQTCIQVLEYLKSLPANIDTKENKLHKYNKILFNLSAHPPKDFRHFKYAISQFLSSLLSSSSLINQVAALEDSASSQMEPLYTRMIENELEYIHTLSRDCDMNVNDTTAEYWKFMLRENYTVLEKVNALLPSDMFLLVIRGLLDNKLPAVRRKAMELFNTRFQQQAATLAHTNLNALLSLLPSLASVVSTIGENVEDAVEVGLNQQTALFSLKILIRYLAPNHPQCFKEVFSLIMNLLTSGLPHDNILAGIVLCLSELVSALRANSVPHLPKFMPALLNILKKQRKTESSHLVILSIVTAILKIVETLSNFLSPYFDKLLFEICIISSKLQEDSSNNRLMLVIQKLKSTRQKISSCIPIRVLLPAVNKCYFDLLAKKKYAATGPLMSTFSGSFSSMTAAELSHCQPEMTSFFTQALQYCSDSSDDSTVWDDISFVEGYVVDALVALVLKLSESSFKPLYFSLFHWATSTESHKNRVITFYRLSSSIADCLKGLFVLFAGHFLKNAAMLLDENNLIKSPILYFGSGDIAQKKSETLLHYVLKTLHTVFLHDRQKFINKERFDSLMQPVVDQLENNLGGLDSLAARNTNLVIPCLTQLTVAVADDALWKDLNYQVLLKTRHSIIQVRLGALRSVCEIARNLGEDFLPFLPETIPFLAELLEDEEEEVEKETRKAIQDLEEVLGEQLQKYF